MYNLELSKEYFREQAEKEGSVMRSADSLYNAFLQENIIKPLGFKSTPSTIRVMISGHKEHVDVHRDEKVAVYDLYDHISRDKFIVSFQRKSLIGIQKITEVLDALKGHPAIVAVNEEDYFSFA